MGAPGPPGKKGPPGPPVSWFWVASSVTCARDLFSKRCFSPFPPACVKCKHSVGLDWTVQMESLAALFGMKKL